jgi:dihydrolipoamide dehydrogenase
VLDSAGLLALDERPGTLCVAGGGYIGLELGIAFAKLGTKVTIVEVLPALLPELDRDLAREVERSLKALGVELVLGARLAGVDDDTVAIATVGGVERRTQADRVLVAAGRRPNTDGLGLGEIGIEPGVDGLIDVDDARIAAPRVAAIGDVTAGPALAHKATAEAQVAVRALAGRPAEFAPQAIPVVMFTDPEIATAGMTAADAREEGIEVVAETFATGALGRTATLGRRDGFVRLVAERDGGTVLGAQIAGPHASELIAEATLAIEMGATLEDVALTIHAHPTLAEGLAEAAELALGRPVHVVRRTAAPVT